MADQDPQKPEQQEDMLTRAERFSKVFHNFSDGAYKLGIIAVAVVAIVVGANIWFTMKATSNKVHNTYCESVFWCDTESETAAKAEKARIKAERQLEKEREQAAAAAAEAAEAAARAEAIANGEAELGKWQRFKGWAVSKNPLGGGDDEATEAESN